MKLSKLSLPIAGLLCAATLVIFVYKLNAQSVKQRPAPVPQISQEIYGPVVDSNTQTTPESQSNIRRARGERDNLRDSRISRQDVQKYELTESSKRVVLGKGWTSEPDEPAIPAAKSDVIAIGEVNGAQAFLTNDKTAIYSEFTIALQDILKSNSTEQLFPGSSVVVTRTGGRMRLPSGKVLIRGIDGQQMPQTGRRYLFFLRRNESTQDYSIITGYEINNQQVLPLDGISAKGASIPRLAAYQQYKGTPVADFLRAVQEAISQKTDEIRQGGNN